MPSFITRCPHCETSFNITEEQLRIAQGIVRCGFCLQTFSALEHQLFNDEESELAEVVFEGKSDTESFFTEHGRAEKSGIDTEEDTESHDDEEFDKEDDEDREETPGSSLHDLESDSPQTPGLILKDTDLSSSLPDLPAANEIIPAQSAYEDEAGASEDFPEEEQTVAEKTAEPEFDDSREPMLEDQDDSAGDTESAFQQEPAASDRDSDSEEEYELAGYSEGLSRETAEPRAFSSTEDFGGSTPATASQADKVTRKQELEHLNSLYYDESELSGVEDSNIDALSDEPIAIYHQQQRSVLFKTVLLSANLLLILLLAGQYVWGNLESVMQNDRLNPFTSALCSLINCPETEQFDLSRFETEELLVNAHPDIDNALLVDFIFRNTAAYAQQFPMVELNFTDINQRLLANRLFGPDEYLEAELQQFTRIPAQSSVQVRLEIADPGPAAINYTLALRAPSMAR